MSNAYLTYAAKRLGQAVVVILLAYVFTFVVVSILPGDPITNVLRDPQNGFTENEIGQLPVKSWSTTHGPTGRPAAAITAFKAWAAGTRPASAMWMLSWMVANTPS